MPEVPGEYAGSPARGHCHHNQVGKVHAAVRVTLREIDGELKMNAAGLDFSNSYFRNSDLSGIDFRKTNLEGSSLLDSKLSGVYFPDELSPEEIRLSRDTGTRMRYKK